jgi:hypothetical protein
MASRSRIHLGGPLPFRPSATLRAALYAGTVLVLPAMSARRTRSPVPAASSDPSPGCRVEQVLESPLRVGGGEEVYVNPAAMTVSAGRILLLGRPTFVWSRRRGTSGGSTPDDSTALGVVLENDGSAHLVPAPGDARRIVAVRAAASGDGGWDVLVGEGARPPVAGSDNLSSIRHAVYRAGSLRLAEALPLPPNGTLKVRTSSSLVRTGSTLRWAAVLTRADGSTEVVLFERGRRGWSYTRVPAHRTAYVELGERVRGDPVLAVVEPDSTRTHDANALFLWRRDAGRWHRDRKLAPGLPEPVHQPALGFSGGREIASWMVEPAGAADARMELRMLADPFRTPRPAAFRVDDATAGRYASIMAGERMFWISDHLLPGGTRRELRVSTLEDGGVEMIRAIPNPFLETLFNAVARNESELVLAGAVTSDHGAPAPVVSRIMRIQLRCNGTPAPGRTGM